MPTNVELDSARRWFAEDIREVAPVLRNNAIIEAFAKVPREDYLGDGPWGIHSRLHIGDIHPSETTSPHHLYHDVLVSIDADKGINNGLPSLWARVYDNLDIKAGASVLQVGAGVGYFTAILAELVAPTGRVISYEIDSDLAECARHNLRHYPNVEVICGDATKAQIIPKIDVLIACAGVTHVPLRWLDSLNENGQMMLPYSGTDQWGLLLHLTKNTKDLPIKSLGPAGFYNCAGARTDNEAKAISVAMKASGNTPDIAHYHLGKPPKGSDNIWVVGQSYWISKS